MSSNIKANHLKRLFCFIVLAINFTFTYGQSSFLSSKNSDVHTYITAKVNNGLVLPHHSSMSYLIEDFTRGGELTIGRRYFYKDHWTSVFNYPEIGFGIHYGTFGNNDVFGVGLAVFHYINYNLYNSPKLVINNRIAAGIGVGTKPFDINNNLYNDVSGSLFNVFLSLGLSLDYRISDRISLSFSTDLDHMSNGAIKRPNSGINVLNSSIGTKYHFNTQPTPVYQRIKPQKCNLHELLVVGNAGFSQPTPFNTQKYFSSSMSINYLYRYNQKKAIGIGFDQFYSEAAPYAWGIYDDRYKEVNYTAKDYMFNGLFASYNVYLNKTTIFMNLGVYLQTGTKPQQPLYPRVGVRHQITPKLLASLGIKASFFRSEFLEFGLGYRFNLSKKQSNL